MKPKSVLNHEGMFRKFWEEVRDLVDEGAYLYAMQQLGKACNELAIVMVMEQIAKEKKRPR